MAQKVVRELVCDLTGEPAAETVTFGIDGKAFEVDLTERHAAILRETLDDYVKVARSAGKLSHSSGSAGARARSGGARPSANREHLAAVRKWARANGMSVNDRGRISAQVLAAFDAAHPGNSHLAAVG